MRELTDFDDFLDAARTFWRTNLPPDGERVILVEAMSQDLRVTLRNMTVANALRRVEPARVVVYSGADEDWNQVVWTYFNLDEIRQLCEAYGAAHVMDVHRLVDARVAGGDLDDDEFRVFGLDLGGDLPASAIPDDEFARIVDATTCRMARVPRMADEPGLQAKRGTVEARSHEFARIYEALFDRFDVLALVSSHVDYNNFGLAVEASLRHDVPVIFPQSTGGLKSYALFPEHHRAGEPIRSSLTRRVGEFFEETVWPLREELRDAAELTVWRAKATLGRPSWWRPGATHSSVDLRGHGDRSELRRFAARRLDLDPSRPTIAAFSHALSDALGTNVEVFADLADWLEQTAEYAVEHPEVNWLFVDHPQQAMYDESGFFDRLAERFADTGNLRFVRSMDLSKNFISALTDLVVTVRGSVSNEYPVLGIPAIQCGWSDWSDCGFTEVAESVEEYFALIDRAIEGLLSGRPLMTPEQIERARLWSYFYRSMTDVPSGLIQQWPVGEGDRLFDLLAINMKHMETDAEPAFVAVRRLWQRRDPFLTRVDWLGSPDDIRDRVATVTPVRPPATGAEGETA